MLADSLYIYGVDYMSTEDVQTYFSRYSKIIGQDEVNEESFKVIWINDSSCVVKFPSEYNAQKAYHELKLSESRSDDRLPPLEDYLKEYTEWKSKKTEEKKENPDYDDLFASAAGIEVPKEAPPSICSRNFQEGLGFIDVMGFKLITPRGDSW